MITVGERPALLVVDVQRDFCPGGSLGVPGGDEVVEVLNEYARRFAEMGFPVIASRDWHPAHTTHFKEQGGPWPRHCVAGTPGAEFHPDLRLPPGTIVVSKGTQADEDAYSAFQARDDSGASLKEVLGRLGVGHLFVGGLATDYCVKESVLDGRARGLGVSVLLDAIRGVEVRRDDSSRALDAMMRAGARTVTLVTVAQDLSAFQPPVACHAHEPR